MRLEDFFYEALIRFSKGGKLHAKERYKEKAKMRKAIKAHEEKDANVKTTKQED